MPMGDVQLTAGPARLAISPDNGGRWSSLNVDGLELLGRGANDLIGWGCFPMAPYAGRIRHGVLWWRGRRHQLPVDSPPHAIHGVVLDRPWAVTTGQGDHRAGRISLRCDFDTRWPWPGHVVQTLQLTGRGLDVRLEVHADDVAMPAWTGLHPWFARRLAIGEPARLEVRAAGILPRDDEGMPRPEPAAIPPPPHDDVFVGVDWPAAVVWDGALRLEISAGSPFAVVFDERPEAICIEPQTAPPNAVELDLAAVIEPGHPLTLQTTMTWH